MSSTGFLVKPNTKSYPMWLKDFGGNLVQFPAKLRVEQFNDMAGTKVTVTATPVKGANAAQSVTIGGGPAGGTFTLTSVVTGSTGVTAPIAYNAPASAVQTALEALFGGGNVLVTGSAGGPYTVTYVGPYGFQPVANLTAQAGGLTGGTSPSVTVASTTTGVAGDQTLTVTALLNQIYNGTRLNFNTGGSAMLTQRALVKDTVLQVDDIVGTVNAGSIATVSRQGNKTILSGILVGRTYAERTSNLGFGPWNAADDEGFLLMFTLDDALNFDDCELVRVNTTVAENYLPDFANWPTDAKTFVRSKYTCIIAEGG